MPEERRRILYEKELKKHHYRKAVLLQVLPADLVIGLTYYIYNGYVGVEHPDYYTFPITGIFDRLSDGLPLFRDIYTKNGIPRYIMFWILGRTTQPLITST